MKKLFETNFSDSYELSKLLEMINLEISLGINYEVNSITYIVKVKLNEHYVSRICLETPSTCPKLFYLYCLVGGKSAENMLISYLTGNKSIGVMRYHAINSLSELLNPSEEFIENILLLIESLEDKDIVGTLIVNLGIITRKSSTPIDIQTKVAETFLNFIETSSEKCIVTPFITDIFIGLGNLQDKITLHKLLLHIETCMKYENYQIVALNALRQLYSQSEVQKWLLKLLSVGSCKLKSNIISILADECVLRNKNGAAPNWPQVDFNEIDELLHYWLVSNMFHYNNCPSVQQLYQYFEKKMHPKTKNLFKKFYFYYVNELRRKRDLYSGYMDHETCSNKLNSFGNYALTLNSDAFINYKYQKHCNGEQIFGKSKLNAVYKTGISTMLEDESNYIVTNRLGKTINVLGRSFDMGSITIYNFNRTMRIYHNFDGETRADIISEFICQIGTLNYPAFYHIPLYTFPIGIILMSFGIHISGDLNLTVSCPEDGIFNIQPVSKIRVALEGLGTFPPIQAAINLGATFNTRMDTYLQPIPHWCTNSSVGYEPMIISTEAWFLIPPNPRQHFTPEFLKWEIGESNDIPLTEFCLDPNVPQTTTSPREDNTTFTETTTKSASATLSSTLTSASVKTNETNLYSENSVKYNFK
ncbi:uncharacterized protein [Centruroides vittatus]|uniref:uncharacterized protein n=1 Tax=Centruroides vittatus TaxID=120091 RepID=UPI00351057D6